MTDLHVRTGRVTRIVNRWTARRCVRRGRVTAFVSQPEPRTIGQYARGRQLCAGNVLFAGSLVDLGDRDLWQIDPPDAAFAEGMQGFTWLDDLAAVGDGKARALAQDWLWRWIALYGDGRGPGWQPDIAGRRVIRWITHALLLLRGQPAERADGFFRCLSGQAQYLSATWPRTRPGLPRFEALSGLIFAGLSLERHKALAAPAVAALADCCDDDIAEDGGIASRNPEELTEILTLLNWSAEVLHDSGHSVPGQLASAITRIAPTLRALRHADGGLARFHGGGRGQEGRLDMALAAAGTRARPDPMARHMGYVRLAGGRTTLIADAGRPPGGAASTTAHASSLAIELTSGRRPFIVSCGSGVRFGSAWRRAGRATPSHSTLCLDDRSSAQLAAPDRALPAGQEPLIAGPAEVIAEVTRLADGMRLEMAHDGYREATGLTHARTVEITFDGRGIAGEDVLTTLDDVDERLFKAAREAGAFDGLPFDIRFHLHPDVDISVDLNGKAVSFALKSSEIWILRFDGEADLHIAPSVYLETGRLRPRPSRQVVLSGRALAYATRVRWSLAKAQDTPTVLRDTLETDPFADVEIEEAT